MAAASRPMALTLALSEKLGSEEGVKIRAQVSGLSDAMRLSQRDIDCPARHEMPGGGFDKKQ